MRRTQIWMALTIVAAAGCSREPDLIPVTGSVKVDGQLTEGVQVSFWPADDAGKQSRNRYAVGMSGRDGRFEVRSVSEKGIEAGEYKVTFTRSVVDGKVITDPKKKASHARQTLPARYGEQDQTDITARVTKDSHDFVFDLSSKPK
jgi:hypothetical protein